MNLNKDNNFISFVVYGGKSAENTINFLKQINQYASTIFSKYEFIVLNDQFYDDKNLEKLQSLKFSEGTQLNIVSMSYHQGIEKAMNAGIDFAIGDYVFEFDIINIDYSLDEIKKVYEKCVSGADIVSANSGKHRHKLFYRIFNRYSKNQYKISSNTFFLLSRRAINRINSMSVSIPYRKAVYSNCGLEFLNYVYKPVKKHVKDESKKDKRGVIANSLVLYTNVFFKLALTFTIIMTAISIAAVVYTLIIYFTKDPIEGWTTMMLIMSVGFSATFIFMLVILVYLKIIVNLNFEKQKYLVESVKKGNKE